MPPVVWKVAERIRADLVTYAAPNLTGKRSAAQVFPRSMKGRILSEDIRSMIIRAPHGVRVVLCTSADDDWERHPWRAIRIVAGSCMASARGDVGLPGVHIPDVDFLDPYNAKKTNPDLQSSYPMVGSLAEGKGWTFGRVGLPSLKGHIRMIRVEPDGDTVTASPTAEVPDEPDPDEVARILAIAEERLDPVAMAALRRIVDEVRGHR